MGLVVHGDDVEMLDLALPVASGGESGGWVKRDLKRCFAKRLLNKFNAGFLIVREALTLPSAAQ